MNKELLEKALDALEEAASCVQNNYEPDRFGHDWDDLIEELKQALGIKETT